MASSTSRLELRLCCCALCESWVPLLHVHILAQAPQVSTTPSISLLHAQYDEMYARSITDPAGFWSDIAQEFTWKQQVSWVALAVAVALHSASTTGATLLLVCSAVCQSACLPACLPVCLSVCLLSAACCPVLSITTITTTGTLLPMLLLTQWDKDHVSYNFDVRQGPISVQWFKGGTTNICYNALDR
jgi:Acetyl-coenzyme A synthetase N-terminus